MLLEAANVLNYRKQEAVAKDGENEERKPIHEDVKEDWEIFMNVAVFKWRYDQGLNDTQNNQPTNPLLNYFDFDKPEESLTPDDREKIRADHRKAMDPNADESDD